MAGWLMKVFRLRPDRTLYFLNTVYHSDAMRPRKVSRLIGKLAAGKKCGKTVVICLSFFENDELDLIPAKEIMRPLSHPGEYRIVGLGKDDDDARSVAAIIVQDVFDKTGDARLKEYFREESLWQPS